MAARSVVITVQNNTDSELIRSYYSLSGGIWDVVPPEKIAPGKPGVFESESDGFLTGTEGEADYTIDREGTVKFFWDDPYAGSNKYSYQAPKGYAVEISGGDGDNANVTFTLTKQKK